MRRHGRAEGPLEVIATTHLQHVELDPDRARWAL